MLAGAAAKYRSVLAGADERRRASGNGLTLRLGRGETRASRGGEEVVTASSAGEKLQVADADLVPLGELIRRTPGAHRIGPIDDLRCDAFGTEEELDELPAFVAESRRGAARNGFRTLFQRSAGWTCWPDEARSLTSGWQPREPFLAAECRSPIPALASRFLPGEEGNIGSVTAGSAMRRAREGLPAVP